MKAGLKKILSNQNGFTIIELLVVLTIVGIVIGTVGQFFVLQVKTYNDQQDRLTIHEEALKASNSFNNELMACGRITSITISTVNGEQQVSELQYVTPEGASILRLTGQQLIKNPGTSNQLIVAKNIKSINMKPYQTSLISTPAWTDQTNNDFVNTATHVTTGLQITLNMISNQQESSYTQEIFFRNAP